MLPALFNDSLAPFTTANRLSALFDHAFGDGRPMAPALPFAVWEDEDAVRVEIDAPGVTGEDIDVSVHENLLTVRGERKARREGGCDSRTYGRFEQRLTLPAPVDAAGVEATLADGVLTVTLLKSEAAKPRKIAVKSA
jgi:HSP20 family protein